MKFEEWYFEEVKKEVMKNPFRFIEYTGKDYDELAKSIKNSLKRQKIFPQQNSLFVKKINFAILKFTSFSISQLVNITDFYHNHIDDDFKEFFAEFKNHKSFYAIRYMKSADFNVLSYQQWFYYEFSKAHNELNQNLMNQLESINNENILTDKNNLYIDNEQLDNHNVI